MEKKAARLRKLVSTMHNTDSRGAYKPAPWSTRNNHTPTHTESQGHTHMNIQYRTMYTCDGVAKRCAAYCAFWASVSACVSTEDL